MVAEDDVSRGCACLSGGFAGRGRPDEVLAVGGVAEIKILMAGAILFGVNVWGNAISSLDKNQLGELIACRAGFDVIVPVSANRPVAAPISDDPE